MENKIKGVIREKAANYKQYMRAKENGLEEKFKELENDFKLIDSFIKILEPSEKMIFIYRFLEKSTVNETALDLACSHQTFYRKQSLIVDKFKRFIN